MEDGNETMMEGKNGTARLGRLCREFLDGVLAKIDTFGDGVYVLDNECLASLNIRKAEPINIEEKSVDFGPRFFYPRFTLQEAREKTSAYLADCYPDASDRGLQDMDKGDGRLPVDVRGA